MRAMQPKRKGPYKEERVSPGWHVEEGLVTLAALRCTEAEKSKTRTQLRRVGQPATRRCAKRKSGWPLLLE
jgi:hypothetical protein